MTQELSGDAPGAGNGDRAFPSLKPEDAAVAATPADEIAAELWAIRRDVQNILPLSRTRPHVFAEQKDELAKRLDKLHTRIRNTFGGTPARMPAGPVAGPRGRLVRVEHRRSA